MSDSKEVAVWSPKKLASGTDLLPIGLSGGELAAVDTRGRELIEARDLIVPTIKVLAGTSDEVMQSKPGCTPGKFYMSGVDQVFESPLRVLLCAHTRSRALFPDVKNPRHAGLDTCLARSALRGTTYGLCEDCKHKEWPATKGEKPACSESHNFVAITPHGPGVIRFSKTSFGSARTFLTAWQVSPYPVWRFPTIITARMETKELPGGKKQPYYVVDLAWQRSETVPIAAQEAAWALNQQIMQAFNADRFGFEGEESGE